jgi:glycerophosphoryl diester phosphodiesterase
VNVIWISHRGIKTHATENTRESFKAALESGFQCFETDLRVTKDNHLILAHDINFSRFTDSEEDLATMERSEIARLNFRDGTKPYFFDEFIEDFAAYSWVLDIKPEHGPRTIDALEKWVQRRKAQDWIISNGKFLTWSLRDENLLKEAFPKVRLYAREIECMKAGFLGLMGLSFFAKINPNKTYAIPPSWRGIPVISPDLVQEFHKRGAHVIAFLPKNPEEEARSLAAGVDEVITDGSILRLKE